MLGTFIESALSKLSITQENVERWVGKPCGCQERIDKLNSLSNWAARVAKGKVEKAKEYLETILGESTHV
jgi:hypothetical protein